MKWGRTPQCFGGNREADRIDILIDRQNQPEASPCFRIFAALRLGRAVQTWEKSHSTRRTVEIGLREYESI